MIMYISKRFSLLFICLLLVSCGSNDIKAPYVHYGDNIDAGPGSSGVHIVQNGDTVWSVSNRYNISMQDIVYENELNPPYHLTIGRRISLPPPNTYIVKPDDSLYTISRSFDLSMTDLARKNNLQSPYIVRPGDELTLLSSRPDIGVPQSKPDIPQQNRQAKQQPAPAQKEKARKIATRSVPKRSSSSGKFLKPVDGNVVSNYGPKTDGLHNNGINIAAPMGTPVRAAENGVVVYADNQLRGYGNLVLVRHDGQYMTAYSHLDKTLISKGQVLKRGQTLGTVGKSGAVDAPQLHFEIRRGTEAIDPARYLGG